MCARETRVELSKLETHRWRVLGRCFALLGAMEGACCSSTSSTHVTEDADARQDPVAGRSAFIPEMPGMMRSVSSRPGASTSSASWQWWRSAHRKRWPVGRSLGQRRQTGRRWPDCRRLWSRRCRQQKRRDRWRCCAVCHPITTWGNGTNDQPKRNPPACAAISCGHYFVLLKQLASRLRRSRIAQSQTTQVSPLPQIAGVDWMIQQNNDAARSVLPPSDTSRIGATGH